MTIPQKHPVGAALASLVLGILGLVILGPLGSIPAIICGHMARARIQKNTEGLGGEAVALAGLILGYIQIGIMAVLLPLLAAILVPSIQKAITSAGMVSTVANGANIYKSVVAGQMEAEVAGEGSSAWPEKGEYRTSTDYFIHLVESRIMNVSYDFFAAPGIPPAKSSDARDFTSEHNAWRLVLGLEEAPEGTPFLFTRNYDPGTLPGGDGSVVLNDEAPFGKKGGVVVLKGGAVFTLRGEKLKVPLFNPAGCSSGGEIEIVGP